MMFINAGGPTQTAVCLAGMLTGNEIINQVNLGNIEISDFDTSRVNPNSYNLRIGDTYSYYDIYKSQIIDLKTKDNIPIKTEKIPEEGMVITEKDFYLFPTLETIHTDHFIPMITGRSSIGRLGVSVHQEAGFGDIGFSGRWTLQLSTKIKIIIYPRMPIAQIYFFTPCGDTGYLYQGKYQNAKEAIGSRINQENK